MAQRTVCICHGKHIGIESIYTIHNGQKINIEGKVEELRKLGREDQLFCTCGCGANLILVAGDRNLREQHFRIKSGTEKNGCTGVSEHRLGIESKILLKLWLDDNFPGCNLDSRVLLSSLSEHATNHELSLFNFSDKIGLCYWYDRTNISSEKIEAIDAVENIRKVIYVADIRNMSENYQYPEYMKKIQNNQGYLLYLDIDDVEADDIRYEQAHLYVHLIVQNAIDGTWHEISVVSDKLSEFRISDSGDISYHDTAIEELVKKSQDRFLFRLEKEKIARKRKESEARERERQRIETLTELEKKIELRRKKEEEERQVAEKEYKKEIGQLKILDFSQSNQPIIDSRNKRWYRCKYCGKIGTESEFYTHGGHNSLNLGICYNKACQSKRKIEVDGAFNNANKKSGINMEQRCPECGSKLIRRKSAYGDFLGCERYPKCLGKRRYNFQNW